LLFPGPPPKGKGGKGFDPLLSPRPPPKGKGGKGFDPLLSLGPLPFPGNGKGPLWAFAIVNKTNNDNNKTKGNNFMEAILFDCININIYKKRYKTEMKYNITIY
jgi:hypothetical protein